MPTILPPPRCGPKKPTLARRAFDVVFNTALVVSALLLTAVVLVRQEQYFVEPPDRLSRAFEQIVQPPVETAGESTVARPAN